MARITRDMLISEVLSSHPGAASIFAQRGLGCPSCLAASMESVDAVAAVHDVELDALLDELNALDYPDTGKES